MLLSSAIVIGSGLLYMLLARPYDKGQAPFGDARLLYGKTAAPVRAEARMRA